MLYEVPQRYQSTWTNPGHHSRSVLFSDILDRHGTCLNVNVQLQSDRDRRWDVVPPKFADEGPGGIPWVIAPGAPDDSVLMLRMESSDPAKTRSNPSPFKAN